MKFIFDKNAPDIPLEVLQAQENDSLILFCGAGISYPAGLPLFKGLVKEVYEELTTEPEPQEEQAIKQWRYDTALELLENRFYEANRAEKYAVRKAIATRLTLKKDANIETHKAILELAKTKEGKYRLVTTNVDHGFMLADPVSWKISDSAPKLPIPKSHKWQSIVYLHGLIDEEFDPDSEQLIFTSGDFGTAYLTERWASRFVSELFKHFTVLFVGYSIDDPVMRYITDAIAADRRQGSKDFKEPYVLAGVKKSQFDSAKLDWKAKGVIPILYEDRVTHSKLHKTLKAWAAYSRDGLNGVERIIKTYAIKVPLQPYEHDEIVKRVVDNLKKTGYAAKVFCELENPPAPIEWLAVFEKEGLLTRLDNQADSLNYFIQPHPITEKLWTWLVLYHFESKQLLEWVIGKGNNLHPRFIELVEWQLSIQHLAHDYWVFWRLLTLNYNHTDLMNHNGWKELQDLEKSRNSITLLRLSKLIEPKVQFSKAFSGETEKPYQADVVIAIDRWAIE